MTDTEAPDKSNHAGSEKILTVIIPIFNSRPEWLLRSLESVCDQTLDSSMYEIIIVDDCSTDPEIIEHLAVIEDIGELKGVSTRVIRHKENAWLAAARMTGVAAAKTEYIAFLDDDDLYENDYLKKSLLLLSASRDVSWVYPTVIKFGQFIERKSPTDFSPFKFFFLNRSPYASMFRKADWERVGQREIFALPNLRFFEDWDTYIRLMALGCMGTPLRDSAVKYRKFAGGLAARNTREYIVSVYATWRHNLAALPRLPLTTIRVRRRKRLGHGRPHMLSIQRVIDKAMTALVTGVFKLPTPVGLIDKKLMFYSLFAPEKFKQSIIDGGETISIAESRMGFKGQFQRQFDNPFPARQHSPRTAVFAHTWWSMGGAEEVFFEWAKIAKESGINRIIDVTDLRSPDSEFLREKFSEVADEQYTLYKYGETPLQQLGVLWSIICYERPKIVFISGSAPMYALLPYIKQHFPETRIIDILHNEFNNHTDWFTVASDYTKDLDLRLVTTDYWRDLLIVKYKEEIARIKVVSNPLDIETRYDPDLFDRASIRASLGIEPECRVISFVARLHHQKHPEVFIQLARLMEGDSRYKFIVVGSGEGSDHLVSQIKSTPNMIYLGDTSKPEQYIAATDVLVCPSRFEGYPLITIIAGAMHVPILVSDVTGHREQVTEGKFGMMYEPTGDEYADGKTIKEILDASYDELVRLGKNGRPFVEERHSLDSVYPVYREIFREQLSS